MITEIPGEEQYRINTATCDLAFELLGVYHAAYVLEKLVDNSWVRTTHKTYCSATIAYEAYIKAINK